MILSRKINQNLSQLPTSMLPKVSSRSDADPAGLAFNAVESVKEIRICFFGKNALTDPFLVRLQL